MTLHKTPQAIGMRAFLIVWIGQLVSLLGSNLTGFALVVWAYQETGSVLQTSLVLLCSRLPSILIAPVAGVLVDRWDRRWTMFFSDAASGVVSVILAILIAVGGLNIWFVYIATALYSLSRVFQEPAYMAATTQLVASEQYGRANGLVQLASAVGEIAAPIAAGFLVVFIGLSGVIALDVLSYFAALATLLIVRFPGITRNTEEEKGQGSLLQEARAGWTYITKRSGMLTLLLFFTAMNFVAGFVNMLVIPLVLSFSTAEMLGIILSGGGIGLLVGSIIMSAWGGPARRVYGVLGATVFLGLSLIVMGLSPNALMIGIGVFGVLLAVPIMQGCNQAIWQSKVPAEIQGRVFATQRMVALAAMPVSMILAGPLAAGVFEPLLAANGPLAGSVGALIGSGPGRGIGFFYLLLGATLVLMAVIGYLYPQLRHVEIEGREVIGAPTPAEVSPTPAEA